MTFVPGQQYLAAFLIFDCFDVPGNYLNYARHSVQTCLSRLDAAFAGDSEILSGDLLPNASASLTQMIKSPSVDVDISRLNARISGNLSEGVWPGEVYMIGILFVVPEGVNMIHAALSEAKVEGYLGLFTIPFTAGTSDVPDLARVLRVSNARIGDRI